MNYTRLAKFGKELMLISFLLAIVGTATIATLGLSPVALPPVPSTASVLGTSNQYNFTISLADSSDTATLTENATGYVYQDTLRGPIQRSTYQKPFIVIQNATEINRDWQVAAVVPRDLEKSVKLALRDPKGNTYSLDQGSRNFTLPTGSRTVYQLVVEIREDIGFDVTYSVVITRN